MKPIYFEKSLGLDIREESMAITLLGKQLRAIDTLGSHFCKIRPLGKNGEDAEEAEKLFLDEINRFLMRHDVSPDEVVLSLPRSLITFKSFELPAPDRKSIDSMIGFELEKHCAASVDDLYFSYHVSEKPDNHFHIVLSAIKKETVDYYLELIQRVNLKPSVIDVCTFSNLNLIQSNGGLKERIAILIDVCSNAIDISILKEGLIESSRNIPIADSEFSASYFKKDLPAEYYEKAAAGLAQTITTEIQTCLASCNSIKSDESVDKLYLFGGGRYAEPLARRLEQDTGVESTTVIPPYHMAQDASSDFTPSLMGTSLSLGLRALKRNWAEINILPQHLRPKKKKFNIKTTIVLSLTVILLSMGMLAGKIIQNNITLTSLEKQLEEVKSQVGVLQKIDLEFENMKQYVTIFNAIDKQSPLKIPLIEELTQIIPQDTWLSDISISKNKMEIKGLSATASALIPILENSAYLKNTGFNGSIISQGKEEKFTIRSTLQVPQ